MGDIFATPLYSLGCSTHLPTFAYFSLFITTINDGNIYIEYHMDFLRNHAHLAGGDTRKAPKNTQFSKSRHTPRGQGSPLRQPLPIHQITANPQNPPDGKTPPHANPSKSTKSRRSLSILSNPNTLRYLPTTMLCIYYSSLYR